MEQEQGRRRLTGEISAAERALLQLMASEPDRSWTADELVDRIDIDRSSSVLMIALYELVNQQKLRLDERFRVRLPA